MKRTQHVAEFTHPGGRTLVVSFDDGSVSVQEPMRVVEFMHKGAHVRVTQSVHGVWAETLVGGTPRRKAYWRLLTGARRNVVVGKSYALGIEEPSWEDA